eukprot:GDKJ01013286.1.p1 GENE.GDKJ01013286.1~~GDKJ01013286.1.p1  ORF type:complete len:159 (-),score=4.69 GDKJ01013286.1:27-503(-)
MKEHNLPSGCPQLHLTSIKCKCDYHVLTTNFSFNSQDCVFRSTDGSLVVDCTEFICSFIFEPNAHCTRLQRSLGIEHQWRYECPSCHAIVAYQCVPPGEKVEVVYLVGDNLSFKIKQTVTYECTSCSFKTDKYLLMKSHILEFKDHFFSGSDQNSSQS